MDEPFSPMRPRARFDKLNGLETLNLSEGSTLGATGRRA